MHEVKIKMGGEKNAEGWELRVTSFMLDCVKLRAQGLSEPRIADRLGKNVGSVSNALNAFDKNYRSLLGIIKVVQKSKYLMRNVGTTLPESWRRWVEAGGYPGGPKRFGYGKTGEIIQEEAVIVKYVFEQFRGGKNMAQLSRDPICLKAGLNFKRIRHMLNNPAYIGKVRFGKRSLQGKPIIDIALWNATRRPIQQPYSPTRGLFGYRRVVGRLEPVAEEVQQYLQMCELVFTKKPLAQIARDFEMRISRVRMILRSPVYAGKYYDEKGQLGDGDWKPIIDFRKWQAMQKQFLTYDEWIAGRREQMEQKRAKICGILRESPCTSSELISKSDISKAMIRRYLNELTEQGAIEKTGGHYGKWRIKTLRKMV